MNGPLLPWRLRLAAAFLTTMLGFGSPATGEPTPELRLPADVTYHDAEGSPGPVVFSHTTHVALADNHCVVCHPAIFSILQPTHGVTHEVMNAGGKCGSCHNGAQASGVQDACEHCHRMGDDP